MSEAPTGTGPLLHLDSTGARTPTHAHALRTPQNSRLRHKSDGFLDDCGAWKAENPTRNLVKKLLNMGDPKSGLLLCIAYATAIFLALTPALVPPRGSTSTEGTADDRCLSVLGTSYEASEYWL